MGCCIPYEVPFGNVASIDTPYTNDMKQTLGPYPTIEVFLWDDATQEYYSTNGVPGIELKFDGNTIHADFGGPGTGFIKIS